MKIFLSYGHDSNAPLIDRIKEYLSKDAEGNLKHEVWIDTSEIKAGKDHQMCFRKCISTGSTREASKFMIYPMNIEPCAELPSYMKENCHFEEM